MRSSQHYTGWTIIVHNYCDQEWSITQYDRKGALLYEKKKLIKDKRVSNKGTFYPFRGIFLFCRAPCASRKLRGPRVPPLLRACKGLMPHFILLGMNVPLPKGIAPYFVYKTAPSGAKRMIHVDNFPSSAIPKGTNVKG